MGKKKQSVMHEYDGRANHRIVSMENGVPNAGPWASYAAIATHKGLLAATDYYNGILPTGVFKVSLRNYETLVK